MLRTVYWFIYFFAYLIYSLPTLHKVKKLGDNLSVAEKDEIIYRLPKCWAKALVKVARATVTVHGEKLIPDGPVLSHPERRLPLQARLVPWTSDKGEMNFGWQ